MKTEIATKYKETEIGTIPEEWGVVDLGQILDKKGYIRGPFGSALRRPELLSEGTPVYEQEQAIYNTRNFRYFIDGEKLKELSRFTVREHDLIISCSGTLGKVSIIAKDDPKGIISQALLLLRPDLQKILPQFLKYFFISDYGFHSIVSRSSGSVQTNIAKREVIENIKFGLPSLEEQKRITEILSSLDDKIELNRKANVSLEKLASVLFKEWFGGISDELPKGWEIKPLDEVADFLNGLALQKYPAESETDYLPVIKIRELNNGITDTTDKSSTKIPDEYILKNGDVVFSWSGSLDVVIWSGGRGALNQHLFKVTSDRYPKWFYYQWVRHFLPIFQGIASDKAVTMGHIKRGHLTESKVLVPDSQTLSKMDELMSPIIEMVINNSVETQNLIGLRDSLLSRLMTGKIRVNI